jgi:hypothetical protein
VGAWTADPSGKSDAGKSYVVFGKANSNAINLSTIADANNSTRGFVINGEVANDRSGYSVSSAGPLITKPPVGLFASAIVLRLIALLLEAL